MQTTRDSLPPESTTEVNKVYIPGQQRRAKFVRSHNKDETAVKSAQGHYIKREGSSQSKNRNSFHGPDTDYQYKYVTLSKEE